MPLRKCPLTSGLFLLQITVENEVEKNEDLEKTATPLLLNDSTKEEKEMEEISITKEEKEEKPTENEAETA